MFRSFSQNFPLGAPGHCGQYNISKNLQENRVEFPEERIVFVFGHQHGWHDVTCEPVTETTPLQYDLLTSKMSKQSILLARE